MLAASTIPPSALPGISPTRGEIGKTTAPALQKYRHLGNTDRIDRRASIEAGETAPHSISPLVGEMPGRAEGGSDLPREGTK
jgi:diaminohydroxyphosphoribosylaminopyrimidine deaminase / 5-amino-6-(5-phosphoribosylamino)uracil reductase